MLVLTRKKEKIVIFFLILDINDQKLIKKKSQNTYNSLFCMKFLHFFIFVKIVMVTNTGVMLVTMINITINPPASPNPVDFEAAHLLSDC